MKKIIFSIIIAVAAVGCSKQQTERHTGNEILIGASVGGVSASKAPVDNWSIVRGLCIVRIDDTQMPTNINGTPEYLTMNRVSGGHISEFDLPQYYHLTKNTYLWGFYPKAQHYLDNLIEWIVDGKTDILVTDKIYDVGTDANPIKANLAFKHVLTQIKVICRADAGQQEATKLRWGKIKSIKVKETEILLRLDKTKLWPEAESSTKGALPLVKPDYLTDFESIDIPDENNNIPNAAGMCFPSRTVQDGRVFSLLIETEKLGTVEVVVDLGAGKKLEAAKKHTITLIFSHRWILFKTAIDDWNDLPPIEIGTI